MAMDNVTASVKDEGEEQADEYQCSWYGSDC